MSITRPLITSIIFCASLVVLPALAQDGQKPKKSDAGENAERKRPTPPKMNGSGGGKSEFGLTPEEMLLIREVMGKVWDKPEVEEARQHLHAATQAYQEALKKAVADENPDAIALMGRMHEQSKLRAHERKHRPGGPFRPSSPDELAMRLIRSEPAFVDLDDPERREELMKYAKEILQSGELNDAVKAVMKAGSPKDSGPARMELRELIVEKLSAKADWIKEAFENAPSPSERFRRPGGNGPGLGPGPGTSPGGKGGGAKPKRPETE